MKKMLGYLSSLALLPFRCVFGCAQVQCLWHNSFHRTAHIIKQTRTPTYIEAAGPYSNQSVKLADCHVSERLIWCVVIQRVSNCYHISNACIHNKTSVLFCWARVALAGTNFAKNTEKLDGNWLAFIPPSKNVNLAACRLVSMCGNLQNTVNLVHNVPLSVPSQSAPYKKCTRLPRLTVRGRWDNQFLGIRKNCQRKSTPSLQTRCQLL